MFDELAIGGVGVIVLVLGIVEACKGFGVSGQASKGLALGLGFGFVALASAMERELIPATWIPYIEIVVLGLGGSLAAMGIYDLVMKRRLPAGDETPF